MKARAGFFLGVAAVLLVSRTWADTAPAALPGPAYDGDRYANLWTKSPFAIATADAPAASEDYQLVGMAQFDGVSYVSLIDKQNQNHFVLASDQPIKDPKHNLNLQLVSIAHGRDGSSAVILRNGESLTLRQDETAATPAGMPFSAQGGLPVPPPGIMVPSPNPSVGGVVPGYTVPPYVRFHRRLIHIPPPPPR